MLYFCLKFVPILRIIQYNLVVLEVAEMIFYGFGIYPLKAPIPVLCSTHSFMTVII